MVYQFQNQDTIVWDLRVFRVDMIKQYWIKISQAQDTFDYSSWLRYLHLCESVVNHAISKTDNNEEYNSLRKNAIEVANQYQKVFSKSSASPQGRAEIEDALIKIEKYLYRKIDKAGLFGKNREIRGL